MESISSVITYILGFKVYVMLPVVIFIFAMIFRLNIKISVTSALAIGIGFIGIFITFDFFIATIGPAIKILISRTGLTMNVLDVGWPPLASIAWSLRIAPVMILVIIAVNILMLVLRLTKVVNIDIWNFWHFLMVGSLVYAATASISLSVAAVIAAEVVVIKIAEWGAPHVYRYTNIPGIAITTLSVGAYYPVGVIGNALIDKIPFINKLKADPVSLKKKLGLAGEPVIIGFLMGILLGIGGGYELKKILEIAFSIAAVIVILPAMCGILASGLIPISEGMKVFIKKKLPHVGETYIGLDNAVIMGDPAIIVSGLLLMPVALVLAFILPGINFIPLGDLPNTMALVAMFVVATRGNVVRTFIIGIPVITAQLYVASYMAETFTKLASDAHFTFTGYSGTITSYMDGGLPLRLWLYKLFSGSTVAMIVTPAVLFILFLTWYISKKELEKNAIADKKKVRSKK